MKTFKRKRVSQTDLFRIINPPNISADLKGPKVKNIKCAMDDVRDRFLVLPHGTTPAAVTTNKNIKMSSFKSNENIQKKEGELE